MTVAQSAERLEISISLVYRLIEEGRLGCVRIGQLGRRGKVVIREKDLRAFVEALEKASAKRYGNPTRLP
jgi:excisionase family DNA binding protein